MALAKDIRRVLIIANYQKGEAKPLAEKILSFLQDRGVEADIFGFSGAAEFDEVDAYDLAVTLGGDGTVLFAARSLADSGIPILPVNLGNFGFITETSVGELFSDLEKALRGDLKLGKRLMLEFCLFREAEHGSPAENCDCCDSMTLAELSTSEQPVQRKLVSRGQALNDVVITGSAISKLINLVVHIDRSEHIGYRADGIIFSTSTGSTAYSAAAGGPILHPEMEAIILNPICPFTLSHRPLVLPAHADIIVEVLPQQRAGLGLTIDGQISLELKPGDRLRIKRAENPVKILYSGNRSFYEVLRAKLNWSGGPELV